MAGEDKDQDEIEHDDQVIGIISTTKYTVDDNNDVLPATIRLGLRSASNNLRWSDELLLYLYPRLYSWLQAGPATLQQARVSDMASPPIYTLGLLP